MNTTMNVNDALDLAIKLIDKEIRAMDVNTITSEAGFEIFSELVNAKNRLEFTLAQVKSINGL